MGGRGSFNSAIILAMSSLETCLVLSRMTEEGRVVTRSGVLGLTSRLGKGVVGAGVGAEEREPGSGAAKLTASSVSGCPVVLVAPWSVWLCLSIVWITEWFWCWVCCTVLVLVWEESASKHVSSRTMRGASLTRTGVVVAGAEAGGKLLEDVWTVAWYSGSG